MKPAPAARPGVGWALLTALAAAGLCPGQAAAQSAAPVQASAQAQADFRNDLAAARGATERRDFGTALPLFERLVQRAPGNADLLIEAARVYGWADRNAESAALYRRALAQAPGRRTDIVPSLAWQLLWAGDATSALPLFEEWSRDAPGTEARAEAFDGLAQARSAAGDKTGARSALREALALRPKDERLQRQLAQALLWNDEPGASGFAVATLRPLVERDPQARELSWALANALNFDGRHREALAEFQRWPAPVQEGERMDLARAWRWAGYEDRAQPLLQGVKDPEAVWLRDFRVAREVTASGHADLELSEDRDHLHSRAWVLGASARPLPDAAVEFNARQLALEDPFGSPNATSFEVAGRIRLGSPGALGGTLWPQLVLRQNRIAQTDPWSPLTFAARLKWIPADRWRVDAEQTRELVETPLAFANRVTVDVASIGAEWRRDPRWTFAGSLAHLHFDDGTTRERLNARTEWALLARPRWVVGAEWSQFERTHDGTDGTARGYWNPLRYQEGRLTTAVSWEWRPFDVQARFGLARSREVDDGGASSYGAPHQWELAAAMDASPALRWRASIGGTGRGLGITGSGSSGAGYWRRWVNLGLTGWF